jgi:hypothetical protein
MADENTHVVQWDSIKLWANLNGIIRPPNYEAFRKFAAHLRGRIHMTWLSLENERHLFVLALGKVVFAERRAACTWMGRHMMDLRHRAAIDGASERKIGMMKLEVLYSPFLQGTAAIPLLTNRRVRVTTVRTNL